MKIRALRKIQEQILAEPTSLYMQDYFCGTAACIAGHAVLNAGWKPHTSTGTCAKDNEIHCVWDVAREVLDLTERQAERLFITLGWPENFDERYCSAKTAEVRAKVAAERIDVFIDSKGAK